MRPNSPYHYHLHLGDKPLGPYDRRTIAGMRIKGLIELSAKVRRNDGHEMSVAQLLADRFEMADADSLKKQAAHPPTSGFWPAFLANFGGNLFKTGAFGFVGEGEVRFQGEYLRLTARRKTGVVGTELARFKLPLAKISRAYVIAPDSDRIKLYPLRGHAFDSANVDEAVELSLGDSHSAHELIELMNLPDHQT